MSAWGRNGETAGGWRGPGLINGALIAGLLLGPAIGAFLSSAIGGILTGSAEYFGFYLAWTVVPGYLVLLPVMAVTLLTLRHFRQDHLWLCALIGIAAGLAYHYGILRAPIAAPELLNVMIHVGLPFAAMAIVMRLIAGPRM